MKLAEEIRRRSANTSGATSKWTCRAKTVPSSASKKEIAGLIGKAGKTIEQIERNLDMHIDVRPLDDAGFTGGKAVGRPTPRKLPLHLRRKPMAYRSGSPSQSAM